MKTEAKIRYSFEISAKELTHIRHALNIASEKSSGSKAKTFKEIHDELTRQVNSSLKIYQQHFTAMLEMAVSSTGEE